MIVWGGFSFSNSEIMLNTGGIYNPYTNTWRSMSNSNAPIKRDYFTAVWTGEEMIVWGGRYYNSSYVEERTNTGGRYNPVSDSWISTSTGTNVPSARISHTAIWTGSEMIIWGGQAANTTNTGGIYYPQSNSWQPTSIVEAPSYRDTHSAVWTGTEMIVWGGFDSFVSLSSGGKYNPLIDSWMPINSINSPSERSYHTAVWIGGYMIIWGGCNLVFADGMLKCNSILNTGGVYEFSTDSWKNISNQNVPSQRYRHTAVWTGKELIVWGGKEDPYMEFNNCLNTGGIYVP